MNAPISDDKKDDSLTSIQCITRSVYDPLMTSQLIADGITNVLCDATIVTQAREKWYLTSQISFFSRPYSRSAVLEDKISSITSRTLHFHWCSF